MEWFKETFYWIIKTGNLSYFRNGKIKCMLMKYVFVGGNNSFGYPIA